jgi:glycosyltransferase involved in cell wall biosynthesis
MKIAFVLPWYGENIPGGAETEAKSTAEKLFESGIDVDILTTCVKDFYSDWSFNYYPEGEYYVNGLRVRRFIVRERDTKLFDSINSKLMNGFSVTPYEEQKFIEEMVNSPSLYEYIRKNASKYDFFIFTPYMFGTTYYGISICPEKSILIPCLHEESYAYMDIYKNMFTRSRGIIFYSDAEEKLAKRIFSLKNISSIVIGGGIESNFISNPSRFKDKYSIDGDFILYAGRKELGKNSQILVDYFSKYVQNNAKDLKLVFIGPGSVNIPSGCNRNIIDLGFIPKQDKYDAYSAAMFLCNPSAHESFSIVLMESWLCGVPVLVSADCDVTREHCINSNGGLYFKDYTEFEACIDYYMMNKDSRIRMGENGKRYVLKNYSWNVIMEKYNFFLLSGSK